VARAAARRQAVPATRRSRPERRSRAGPCRRRGGAPPRAAPPCRFLPAATSTAGPMVMIQTNGRATSEIAPKAAAVGAPADLGIKPAAMRQRQRHADARPGIGHAQRQPRDSGVAAGHGRGRADEYELDADREKRPVRGHEEGHVRGGRRHEPAGGQQRRPDEQQDAVRDHVEGAAQDRRARRRDEQEHRPGHLAEFAGGVEGALELRREQRIAVQRRIRDRADDERGQDGHSASQPSGLARNNRTHDAAGRVEGARSTRRRGDDERARPARPGGRPASAAGTRPKPEARSGKRSAAARDQSAQRSACLRCSA
jgi:hypothetical protein